ncbi:shikimate dehydrogenase [Candidatus Vallotia cooleyia]|uniref:shikimate dehydrogenase n=1 Tax=Candidatus Vallotiella adelgis TaxID=1177211 RepID=UPI001D013920|nr:shikimate dehydrogenase [Candidatus Vallotia cooleyia]
MLLARKSRGQGLNRYAVIGNPVAHSKSPDIHANFAKQTGEIVEYGRIFAPVDGFVQAIDAFILAGGHGLNITIPFKLQAYMLATRRSKRAEAAGAVNTLRFDCIDGRIDILGDNTDGIGLVTDVEMHSCVTCKGAHVLLLGAGGAARGVILPLLERRPRRLTIINRTAARTFELIERFTAFAQAVDCILEGGAPGVEHGVYDIIINATSSSLNGTVPVFAPASIYSNTLAYDMMYAAKPTVFMQHAARLGGRTSDGLGMLVRQAAESFFFWRGVRPNPTPVLTELRATLANC